VAKNQNRDAVKVLSQAYADRLAAWQREGNLLTVMLGDIRAINGLPPPRVEIFRIIDGAKTLVSE
jgi:hypothetical protein